MPGEKAEVLIHQEIIGMLGLTSWVKELGLELGGTSGDPLLFHARIEMLGLHKDGTYNPYKPPAKQVEGQTSIPPHPGETLIAQGPPPPKDRLAELVSEALASDDT